jgi:hypothetical protein
MTTEKLAYEPTTEFGKRNPYLAAIVPDAIENAVDALLPDSFEALLDRRCERAYCEWHCFFNSGTGSDKQGSYYSHLGTYLHDTLARNVSESTYPRYGSSVCSACRPIATTVLDYSSDAVRRSGLLPLPVLHCPIAVRAHV